MKPSTEAAMEDQKRCEMGSATSSIWKKKRLVTFSQLHLHYHYRHSCVPLFDLTFSSAFRGLQALLLCYHGCSSAGKVPLRCQVPDVQGRYVKDCSCVVLWWNVAPEGGVVGKYPLNPGSEQIEPQASLNIEGVDIGPSPQAGRSCPHHGWHQWHP